MFTPIFVFVIVKFCMWTALILLFGILLVRKNANINITNTPPQQDISSFSWTFTYDVDVGTSSPKHTSNSWTECSLNTVQHASDSTIGIDTQGHIIIHEIGTYNIRSTGVVSGKGSHILRIIYNTSETPQITAASGSNVHLIDNRTATHIEVEGTIHVTHVPTIVTMQSRHNSEEQYAGIAAGFSDTNERYFTTHIVRL